MVQPKQNDNNPNPEIDLGAAMGMTGVLIGASAFCMARLSSTVSEGDMPSMPNVFWSVCLLFSSSLSLLSGLALAARSLAVFDPSTRMKWSSAAATMFRACVFIVSHWILMWMPFFFIAMGVFQAAVQYLWKPLSLLVAVVIGLLAMRLVSYLVPALRDTTRSLYPDLKLIYSRRGFLLVGLLLVVAFYTVNSCYRFDLKTISAQYSADQHMEMHVTLAGRILDHDKLRLRIAPLLAGTTKTAGEPYQLVREGKGSYVFWKSLKDVAPGVYRATAYFEGYSPAPFLRRIFHWWKRPNFETRTVIFLVKEKPAPNKAVQATIVSAPSAWPVTPHR
jgi:hypothetical protein